MEETSRANSTTANFITKYDKLQKHCCYCHRSGHEKKYCYLFEKHLLLKKSNIPEKYWGATDPLKHFLMNETIRGYIIRRQFPVAIYLPEGFYTQSCCTIRKTNSSKHTFGCHFNCS